MICCIKNDYVFISVPEILFDYERLSGIAEQMGVKLYRSKNNIRVEIIADYANVIVRVLFSRYHNLGVNFLGFNEVFTNSSKPLVSCVVLLNSNYDFVKDLTIPGIIFNSRGTEIEIIVVHNGQNHNYEFDYDVKVIESEASHIPKAYNKAAREAKGKYLAFFHDDCFLSDTKWIEKCINNLNEEVIAVGPEYHVFKTDIDFKMRQTTDKKNEWDENDARGYLKEVPLVMERDKFMELNGFPESEILGQEDIYLHRNILDSGRKNRQVDVKHYHFSGISTVSLFSTENHLVQNLCNHFIFSKEHIRGILDYGLSSVLTEKVDHCSFLFTHDKCHDEYSPWCEKVAELGDPDRFDDCNPDLINEDKLLKSFHNGVMRAFMVVDDIKGMELISGNFDFNELLFSYINVLAIKKMGN